MQPGLMSASLPSGLARRLTGGQFVMTAEVVPPVSCDPTHLLARATPLKGLAHAVNVTDGAGARAHMSATAAAALLVQAGIEPILQLACRDRNRIALQGELMGAAATTANCPLAPQWRDGRRSSSGRPTCRSVRRRGGSPTPSRPRSPRALPSCRLSSAWIPAWSAAMPSGSPKPGLPAACSC
jgi:methylenetetrahydrofolate reductase (NADPH)